MTGKLSNLRLNQGVVYVI